LVVVVHADFDPSELPALGARVHAHRRGDAACQRGGEQLMRRGAGVGTAELLGLIGGEPVAAIDEDLLAQRVAG